jgi:hypothetical protein
MLCVGQKIPETFGSRIRSRGTQPKDLDQVNRSPANNGRSATESFLIRIPSANRMRRTAAPY